MRMIRRLCGMAETERRSKCIFREQHKEFREFSDPMYNSQRFPPEICNIIDTPQFHRLKYIKQLGCCDYVWPSAGHNRMAHSIGVCHLAGKLIDSLRAKQTLESEITDVDKLCVMIAGLCHDMGHGPFSHTFDQVYVPMMRPEKNWKHEQASTKMFDHMLKENSSVKKALVKVGLTEMDFTFIREAIDGKDPNVKKPWPYNGRGTEKAFLYDIISNKNDGLDVDRLDYLLRDQSALNVGTSFRESCLQRIFGNARVMSVDKRMRICYAAMKIRSDLESVGDARYKLHDVAYNHKTAKAIELMVCDILKIVGPHMKFNGDDGNEYEIADCMDNMAAYEMLDDRILYAIKIFKVVTGPDNLGATEKDRAFAKAQQILRRLETRDLYLCIMDSADINKNVYDMVKSQDPRERIAELMTDALATSDPVETEAKLSSDVPATPDSVKTETELTADAPAVTDSVKTETELTADAPAVPDSVKTETDLTADAPAVTDSVKTETELTADAPAVPDSVKTETDLTADAPAVTDSVKTETELTADAPAVPDSVKTETELTADAPAVTDSVKTETELTADAPAVPDSVKTETDLTADAPAVPDSVKTEADLTADKQPELLSVKTEDLRLFISNRNFGSGEQYPLANVMSYTHKDLKAPPTPLSQKNYPSARPQKFSFYTLTVFYCDGKHQEEDDECNKSFIVTEDIKKKMVKGFTQWHEETKMDLEPVEREEQETSRARTPPNEELPLSTEGARNLGFDGTGHRVSTEHKSNVCD